MTGPTKITPSQQASTNLDVRELFSIHPSSCAVDRTAEMAVRSRLIVALLTPVPRRALINSRRHASLVMNGFSVEPRPALVKAHKIPLERVLGNSRVRVFVPGYDHLLSELGRSDGVANLILDLEANAV